MALTMTLHNAPEGFAVRIAVASTWWPDLVPWHEGSLEQPCALLSLLHFQEAAAAYAQLKLCTHAHWD